MVHRKYSLRRKKELYYLSLIVIVGGILLFSVFGPEGYLALRKAQREEQIKRERVEEIRRNNAERMNNIDALKSDEEAIERYAREKGYGREDEIVEHLSNDSKKEE